MFGELVVSPAGDAPPYVSTWDILRKRDEVLSWIKLYYQTEDEFWFDLEDWENSDDLEYEISNLEIETSEIIKKVWGIHLTVDEFEKIVGMIDSDQPTLWKPSEDRIEIEDISDEFEFDEL